MDAELKKQVEDFKNDFDAMPECGEVSWLWLHSASDIICKLQTLVEQSEKDAERFAFEHTNHKAMESVQMFAIVNNHIFTLDWWRNRID